METSGMSNCWESQAWNCKALVLASEAEVLLKFCTRDDTMERAKTCALLFEMRIMMLRDLINQPNRTATTIIIGNSVSYYFIVGHSTDTVVYTYYVIIHNTVYDFYLKRLREISNSITMAEAAAMLTIMETKTHCRLISRQIQKRKQTEKKRRST